MNIMKQQKHNAPFAVNRLADSSSNVDFKLEGRYCLQNPYDEVNNERIAVINAIINARDRAMLSALSHAASSKKTTSF